MTATLSQDVRETQPAASREGLADGLGRLERRELHRSRTVATSVALAASTVAAGALGVAIVLHRLGVLQVTAADDAGAVPMLGLDVRDPVAVLALGLTGWQWLVLAGALLVGAIVWICLAIAPGRRARHAVRRSDVVLLVDDRLLASGVSATAAKAGGVRADAVRTSVSRRRADVALTASSGITPDAGAARSASQAALAAMRLVDELRVHARVHAKPEQGGRR